MQFYDDVDEYAEMARVRKINPATITFVLSVSNLQNTDKLTKRPSWSIFVDKLTALCQNSQKALDSRFFLNIFPNICF